MSEFQVRRLDKENKDFYSNILANHARHALRYRASPATAPARHWGHATSGGTRASVLLLRFRYAHPPPEQLVALGGLLGDRGYILGQQVSLLHQRLGGLFHPAQVVLLGKIALPYG